MSGTTCRQWAHFKAIFNAIVLVSTGPLNENHTTHTFIAEVSGFVYSIGLTFTKIMIYNIIWKKILTFQLIYAHSRRHWMIASYYGNSMQNSYFHIIFIFIFYNAGQLEKVRPQRLVHIFLLFYHHCYVMCSTKNNHVYWTETSHPSTRLHTPTDIHI